MERNYLIDRKMVKSKMILQGISTIEICDLLQITDTSFYNKINGKREFTETEISTLVAIFGTSIFFDNACYVKGSKSYKKGGKQ